MRITDTAARSSAAEPDPRATDTEANPPLLAMAKAMGVDVSIEDLKARNDNALDLRNIH